MSAMALRDVREAVAAVALHDLSPTNILSVAVDRQSVVLTIDTSLLEKELADAKSELEECEKALKEAEAEAEANELRADKAEALLAEVKDGPAIAECLAAKEMAEENAAQASLRSQQAEHQLEQCRKRKGLTANYVAMHDSIISYLHRSEDPKAQELIKKLYAK